MPGNLLLSLEADAQLWDYTTLGYPLGITLHSLHWLLKFLRLGRATFASSAQTALSAATTPTVGKSSWFSRRDAPSAALGTATDRLLELKGSTKSKTGLGLVCLLD